MLWVHAGCVWGTDRSVSDLQNTCYFTCPQTYTACTAGRIYMCLHLPDSAAASAYVCSFETGVRLVPEVSADRKHNGGVARSFPASLGTELRHSSVAFALCLGTSSRRKMNLHITLNRFSVRITVLSFVRPGLLGHPRDVMLPPPCFTVHSDGVLIMTSNVWFLPNTSFKWRCSKLNQCSGCNTRWNISEKSSSRFCLHFSCQI